MFSKKRFIFIAMCIFICLFTAACFSKNSEARENSMFVEVERTMIYRVVYHKDTKVMYTISYGTHNSGAFTLLVDENGDPMLWEE